MESAPDGVKMPFDATTEERIKSFQYKYKCVDLKEYKDMLSKQIGNNFSFDDVMDNINNIKDQ